MLDVICRTDLADGDLGGSRHDASSGGQISAGDGRSGGKPKCGPLVQVQEHELSRRQGIGVIGGRKLEVVILNMSNMSMSSSDMAEAREARRDR